MGGDHFVTFGGYKRSAPLEPPTILVFSGSLSGPVGVETQKCKEM